MTSESVFRGPACLMALCAVTALPSTALAQPSAGELFDRGLTAMKRGDYDAACPAFAESFKLDPLPGAMFTLAECEARAGQVASAWLHFGAFTKMIGQLPTSEQQPQAERVAEARRRRREIAELVPWLTIRVPASLPDKAQVLVDRRPIARTEWGKPVPLDPGVRRVVLRNPDGGQTQAMVQLERGERRQITLARPKPGPKPPPPEPPESRTPLLVGGFVSLAVGVAGLATATGVAISLLGRKDTIEANCEGNLCNPAGYEEAEAVATLNVVGTVAFAVGVTAAVASVPLLWLGADDDEPELALSLAPMLGGGSLLLRTRW